MRCSRIAALVAALAVVPLGLGAAAAQVIEEESPTIVVEEVDQPSGFALAIGGGVADFPSGRLNDLADPGVAWDVRAIFGLRTPVGVEFAYLGAAHDLNTPGGDAILLKNGVEANLRLNLGRMADDLYYGLFGVAGAGWTRLDVTDEDNTFDRALIGEDDDLLTVPVGGGIALGYGDFRFETRFTYRFAFEEDLIADGLGPVGDGDDDSDDWTVNALLGYEF